MSKNRWEERVSKVLHRHLSYVYKPPDGKHGGAVKMDFLACDWGGTFWMVEVKATSNAAFFRPDTKGSRGITPLQRRALDQAAKGISRVYVIVGSDRSEEAYVFDWREMRDEEVWYFKDAARTIAKNSWKDEAPGLWIQK